MLDMQSATKLCIGAEGKGELVYLLICPKCGIGLGEWDSLETREDELREFARTLKVRH
jgi:hypothetical protein